MEHLVSPKTNLYLLPGYTRFIITEHLTEYISQLHLHLASKKNEAGYFYHPELDDESVYQIKQAGIKLIGLLSAGERLQIHGTAISPLIEQLSRISAAGKLSMSHLFTIYNFLETCLSRFITAYTQQTTTAIALTAEINTLFHVLKLRVAETMFQEKHANLMSEIEFLKDAKNTSRTGYFIWDADDQINYCSDEVAAILERDSITLPYDMEQFLSIRPLTQLSQPINFNKLQHAKHLGGKQFWCKGQHMYRGNKLVYLRGIIQDITEPRHLSRYDTEYTGSETGLNSPDMFPRRPG